MFQIALRRLPNNVILREIQRHEGYKMFKKLTVPLDGSELAEGIPPYITNMAASLGTFVVLLSVINPDAIEFPGRLVEAEGSGAARLESAGTTASIVELTTRRGTDVGEL